MAKEDVVIGGHLIPKGLSIQIPVNYIHNNPKYWSEPEKFKPERYVLGWLFCRDFTHVLRNSQQYCTYNSHRNLAVVHMLRRIEIHSAAVVVVKVSYLG